MSKGIGRFLRETIGDIPTTILVSSLVIWALYGYYRSWKDGEIFEFSDYFIILLLLSGVLFFIYIIFVDP